MLNIALCSLEEEFGKDLLENGRNLLNLSLFRISQLIIQYLLHNEDQNVQKIKILQENEECLLAKVQNLQMKNLQMIMKTREMKEELKNRKEMIKTLQESMFIETDFKEFQKCLFCSKVVVNQ